MDGPLPPIPPITPDRRLSARDFERLQRLIHQRFGIHLTPAKHNLVVGRLQRVLLDGTYPTFTAYIDALEADRSGGALVELVDRISTNHTFFNREHAHFDFMRQVVLPEWSARLARRGERDLRVWCAACSSGEEAYMLVIQMMEHFGVDYAHWDAGVLATDISPAILAAAEAGRYAAERVAALPPAMVSRYFDALPEGDYRVKPRLRKEITFRRFNLINPSLPFRKPFHAIFCRNVMIYFDQPTREALVDRLFQATAPGGYLFIGHSESLGRNRCPYEYVQPAVYRRPERGVASDGGAGLEGDR